MRYLILDYETRSLADLKKVGAWEYAIDPSTEILCVAWRVGTRETLARAPVRSWCPRLEPNKHPLEFIKTLLLPGTQLVAHNAGFEQVITRHVLSRQFPDRSLDRIPVSRWLCTAALASALALPRSLEGACSALRLPVQKNPEGKKLIRRHCLPQKPTKNRPCIWDNDPAGLKALTDYCAQDVDAETHLFLRLPELNPTERAVWELDQEMNLTGVKVDLDLVKTILRMTGEESARLTEEVQELTFGALDSANQRAAVLKYLAGLGVALPNLQAKTVSDILKTGAVEGDARRLLEIRQAASKTSTAKYEAMEARSKSGGRLRDILVYHGAAPGRWTGAGVQLQNLPRPTIKDQSTLIDVLGMGDLEWVRALYGEPMNAFSSALRGMLVADPGQEFFCGDYSAIEARVLFWLARHEAGLKAYRENRDLYREIAALIYNKPLAEVTAAEREVGKRAILGSGYGMGAKKFRETCILFGAEITEALAKHAVKTYREKHYLVPVMWGNLERAACLAVQEKKRVTVNRVTFYCADGFLFCTLPSGRRLAYYSPRVKYEPTPWGDKRPRLYFHGVNPRTRKWCEEGTYGGALTENVTQGTARDIMAAAMLRTRAAGFPTRLTVHDEILGAKRQAPDALADFKRLMLTLPAWAGGLPLKVDAWQGPRYRK